MSKSEDIDFGKEEVFETPKKILPANLTSYDFLKTIAIILMVIDHVGFFFYPDESWFRVLGRLCVPIWFFLIGYARTRDIPLRLYSSIGILAASSIIVGGHLLPLTILVTLMIGRRFIDAWMGAGRKGGEALAGLFFMLVLLGIPTGILFEYGAFGLLFTVFGAMCRYRQDNPKLEKGESYDKQIVYFASASFITFVILQAAPMEVLSGVQFAVLVFGMIGVYYILRRFQPAELPTISKKIPGSIKKLIQFTGRRTLEIYVAHLVVFKMVALYTQPERFQFMQWSWTHENVENFVKAIFL